MLQVNARFKANTVKTYESNKESRKPIGKNVPLGRTDYFL